MTDVSVYNKKMTTILCSVITAYNSVMGNLRPRGRVQVRAQPGRRFNLIHEHKQSFLIESNHTAECTFVWFYKRYRPYEKEVAWQNWAFWSKMHWYRQLCREKKSLCSCLLSMDKHNKPGTWKASPQLVIKTLSSPRSKTFAQPWSSS